MISPPPSRKRSCSSRSTRIATVSGGDALAAGRHLPALRLQRTSRTCQRTAVALLREEPAPQFSLKTGTIFAGLARQPRQVAGGDLVDANNSKNGLALAATRSTGHYGVTQKTSWFIGHRVPLMLLEGSFERMLDGEVEVDETFIRGKARNMHFNERVRRITGRCPTDKTNRAGHAGAWEGASGRRSWGVAESGRYSKRSGIP